MTPDSVAEARRSAFQKMGDHYLSTADFALWPWHRCGATKERNESGVWGRCELRKGHKGDHALERGMDMRWSTEWTS